MLLKLKKTLAKMWLIIALVSLLMIFHPLLGQENKQINNSELLAQNDVNTENKEEEDDDDEEEEDDYWTRHFNARYGVSYSHGLDQRSHRRYSYIGLAWKHDFDWVNFNIEGLASRRDFSYSLEFASQATTNENIKISAKNIQMMDASIRHIETQMKPDPRTVEDICASPPIVTSENLLRTPRVLKKHCDDYSQLSNPNASPNTRNINEIDFTLRVLDNQISWQEAYAKFNIGESLQVLVGWHTVIWGQLDFLSPVDIILPLQIGASTGLGLTKSDNRKPQKSLILYYFPVPYIEIQAYLFPELALDSTLLTLIKAKYTNSQHGILSILGYRDAYAIELPEGRDKYRYAARVLFYLEQFTLGLTYYKAYYPYTIDENAVLSERNRNDPEKTKFYHLEIRPELQSWENFGIELAYPIDEWVWKLELLYTNLQDNLRQVETMNYSSQLAEFIEKDDSFDLQTTYYNFILEQKNGELNITEELYIGGFGADAQYGHWLFNLGVLFAYLRRSDIDQRALELSREVNETELGYADQDFVLAPVINIAHYLDQDKTETVGVAFGFLPIGAGIVLYTTREYFESLQLALSLEYFAFNDSDLIEQEGYQLKNAAYPSLRFIFDYKL